MRFLFLVSLVLLFGACSDSKLSFSSEKEFNDYINDVDNGYINSTTSSDMVMEVQVVPPMDSDTTGECSINMRLSRKDGMPVLNTNGKDQQVISEIESYLSFEILNDVYLDDGEKQYIPTFSHYERNYGLKPSIDVFFEFKNIEPKDDPKFVFRDKIFDQGLFILNLNKKLFNSCHVE